jgi:hypothetical protein
MSAPVKTGPRLNAYTCSTCGGKTVTIDIDDGVTPFMLNCRASGKASGGCPGTAQSAMYRVNPATIGEPAWEWYKPTEAATRKLSAGMQEHVRSGGLLIRKREPHDE